MFQNQIGPMFRFAPILIGILAIALALRGQWLLRFLKLTVLSEVFTTPRYRRSARITERLSRLTLVLLGISFLLQGISPDVLPPGIDQIASLTALALSAFILLIMIAVILASR